MELTPGFISGVGVWVGTAFSAGVADAGNQTMVGEGGGVSDGVGVSVDAVRLAGAQEDRSRNPMIREEGTKRRME